MLGILLAMGFREADAKAALERCSSIEAAVEFIMALGTRGPARQDVPQPQPVPARAPWIVDFAEESAGESPAPRQRQVEIWRRVEGAPLAGGAAAEPAPAAAVAEAAAAASSGGGSAPASGRERQGIQQAAEPAPTNLVVVAASTPAGPPVVPAAAAAEAPALHEAAIDGIQAMVGRFGDVLQAWAGWAAPTPVEEAPVARVQELLLGLRELGFQERQAQAAARRCSTVEAAVEWISAHPQVA